MAFGRREHRQAGRHSRLVRLAGYDYSQTGAYSGNQDRRPTLGDVVGAFKSVTTVAYTRGVKAAGWPGFRSRLWQRNYYEHIIRNDESLRRIRHYIQDNPARWVFDRENPQAVRPNTAK